MEADEGHRALPVQDRAADADGDTVVSGADTHRSLASLPSARLDLSALPQGETLGRFAVLEKLGEGGLGVVYKAYDRELNRFVAIKLLRVRSRTRAQAEETRLLLLREAQALARLDHPNVVSVYEVGLHKDDLFLAMAFLEGVTLRQWLEAAARPPAEVLRLFLAAGEGLAAAHRAGLVHRDFKPANVIVGTDGSVRVLDFGLARPVATIPDASSPSVALGVSLGTTTSESTLPLFQRITEDGERVGTPRYMAPEQHMGVVVGAASDQFAFCVALWEALFKVHPFEVDGSPQRTMINVATGAAVQKPPATGYRSRALERILTRGLAKDPAKRYPSMDALLGRLRARLGPVLGRRWAAGAALVLGAAVTAGMAYGQYQRSMLCRGVEGPLGGVWDDERRRALGQAFLATKLPFAAAAWQGAQRDLDAYAAAWASRRADACAATRLRGEQSAELMDLRVACLDKRLGDLRALVQVFAEPDSATVERAVTATRSLPPLSQCDDGEALRAGAAPVKDPAVRARVAAIERKLSETDAFLATQRPAAAAARAKEALEASRAMGSRALTARTLLRLGRAARMHDASEEAAGVLEDAIEGGLASKSDDVAFGALTELALVRGEEQGRDEDAQRLLRMARAEAERLGGGGDLVGRCRYVESTVAFRAGRYEEARRLAEEGAAAYGRALAADDPRIDDVLISEANALAMASRLDEAERTYEEARQRVERAFGPDHPRIASIENNLGNVDQFRGRYGSALARFERAKDIFARAFGEGQQRSLDVKFNVASSLRALGRSAEALALFQSVRGAYLLASGLLNSDVASTDESIGRCLHDLGRDDEALATFRKSVSEFDGLHHPDIRFALGGLAALLRDRGRVADSVPLLRRALAVTESAVGKAHSDTSIARADLGAALVATAKGDEGLALLEQALRAIQGAPNPFDVAAVEVDLSESLVASHGDRARARDLALRARDRVADRVAEGAVAAKKVVVRADAVLAKLGATP